MVFHYEALSAFRQTQTGPLANTLALNKPLNVMASVNLQDAPSQTTLQALWARAWPAGLPTAPQYPLGELPLTRYLRHWATVQPDHPAVIYYGHVMSFAELDRLSDAMARLLQSMGVGAGDRVAVFLPNCPQFHLAFYGILKLGAVHVPVGPMSKSYELLHELEDSGATLLITLDAFMPVVRQVRGQTELSAVLVTGYADVRADDPVLPLPEAMRAPRQHCDDAVELMPALAQWLAAFEASAAFAQVMEKHPVWPGVAGGLAPGAL